MFERNFHWNSFYAYLMSSVAYGTGGGTYSYVCVYRPLKHLTSKEIDCAEHEYDYEYVLPSIIIKCHTPLNTFNSIMVEINTSHAMCNISVQQIMGKI